MALVVGVDLGTQSLKAVVCDEGLVVLGHHHVRYEVDHPRPDHAEQPVARWEAALGPAIAGALAHAGRSAAEVVALGIAGQLDGCVAVDDDGVALGPALIWQDRRAVAQAAAVDAARVFDLTGQVADACHLAPKARWLIDHGLRAARFHQPVSYLVERLTGVAAIDPALASTTMLLELATGAWSEELLAAFALTPAQLPTVRPTCAVAGPLTHRGAALTGLAAGCAVAVGTGDDFATPLGAGVGGGGGGRAPVVCALGTAEVVGTVAAHAIRDRVGPSPMVETHAYPGGGFFVENPGWLSGGAVRWAADLIGAPDDAAFDRLAAEVAPGADGVVFVPALAGAMTPSWRPHARGAFYGLAAGHDRRHLARATLEGLAFACRDVVDRLAVLGLATDDVLLLGGGARSAIWAQLRADVLGRPHRVAARTDTSAVGAAMIAAVGAGLVAELRTAAGRAPPPIATFAPDPSARVGCDGYDAAYARYQAVVAQLAPLATAAWR